MSKVANRLMHQEGKTPFCNVFRIRASFSPHTMIKPRSSISRKTSRSAHLPSDGLSHADGPLPDVRDHMLQIFVSLEGAEVNEGDPMEGQARGSPGGPVTEVMNDVFSAERCGETRN